MNQNKEIVNKLRSSKLRPTKQRIRIADFLYNREKTFHFTIENLNKNINKKSAILILCFVGLNFEDLNLFTISEFWFINNKFFILYIVIVLNYLYYIVYKSRKNS